LQRSLAALSYYKSAQLEESGWKKNGRIAFFIHTAGVLGVVIFLYIIIYKTISNIIMHGVILQNTCHFIIKFLHSGKARKEASFYGSSGM
jgi:hypothetical protein